MKQEKLDEKLHEAIQNGDLAAAGKLIKKGAETKPHYLIAAIDAGDIEQVKFWVGTGMSLNQVTNKLTGETFISRAVFKSNEAILKILVNNGADVAFADNALTKVRRGTDINSLLMTSLLNDNLDITQYLLDNGAKPTRDFLDAIDFKEKFLRAGCLSIALQEGRFREVRREFHDIDVARRAKDKEFGQGK